MKINWRGLLGLVPKQTTVTATETPATTGVVHDYRIDEWATTLGPTGWIGATDEQGRRTLTIRILPSEYVNGLIVVGDRLKLGYLSKEGGLWQVSAVQDHTYTAFEV